MMTVGLGGLIVYIVVGVHLRVYEMLYNFLLQLHLSQI